MKLRHPLRLFASFAAAVGVCFSALAQQGPGWEFDRNANRDALPVVPAGFAVSFFAREPLVRQPCSMAFDAKGRLCVGMGPQYRNPKPNTPGDSVVLVLDTDGDGKADRTKTFATGFNAIQGLAWRGRDLWVANSPDLTVVRDLDGDDVADEYVRVFTDLGNLEHGLHGLNWAPDGKLYMSKGNSKGLNTPERYAPKPFRDLFGLPTPAGAKDFPEPQTFKAADYRHAYHDPEDDWGYMGGVLRCDDGGRNLEIVSRGLRNPWDITFDSGFNWLGTDNDQSEGDRVFSPFQGAHFGWNHPWSSSWSGGGHLPTVPISAPVFHGSGTGIIFYDAPQFPPEFRRVFFVNDWLHKTTFAYRPRWDGALMQPTGGKWQPFITGGTALFRPTDLEVGPDGALWCLGWSRGYGVEWENNKENGNIASEGRVFRIAWTNAPPAKWNSAKRAQPLAKWSVAELIADFAGPLPVWRSDAQDELVRRGASVKSELIAALAGGKLTEAQETWTAWTLGRIAPDNASVDQRFAVAKGSQNLVIQSLRILAHRSQVAGARQLPPQFAGWLTNAEPRLRFEAVQAIWQAKQTQFIKPLQALAASEKDRLTYYSAWNALSALTSTNALKTMLDDPRGGVRCAALLALASRDALNEATASRLVRDTDRTTAATAGLWLRKHRVNSLITLLPEGREFAKEVRVGMQLIIKPLDIRYTVDGSEPSLTSAKYADKPLLFTETTTLKVGLFVNGQMVGNVIEAHYRKAGQAAPVVSLLKPITAPTTLAQAQALLPKADVKRGEQLFFAAGGAGCFNCHRVGPRGNNFAPDLTGLGQRTEARHVIESILAPNAVITEGFNTLTIETKDAEYSGVLLEESGLTLTLGLATGQRQVIAKKGITSRKTAAGSAMPAYDTLLAPQHVADLTAYLLAQRAGPAEAKQNTNAVTAVTPAAAVASTASPKGAGFRFVEGTNHLVIAHSGQPVAEFVFRDAKIPRPYFARLHAPDGTQVSRNFPPVKGVDAMDHDTLHPGLWLAFGDLNGVDFWRNKGRVEHVRFIRAPRVEGGRLSFAVEEKYAALNGREICRGVNEFVLVAGHTLQPALPGTLLLWSTTLRRAEGPLTFGPQHEMGLGFRVATPLVVKDGTGHIRSSHGGVDEAGNWGRVGSWWNYAGTISNKHAGLLAVAAPDSARPVWSHARDYGFLALNPTGPPPGAKDVPSVPFTLPPGEPLRMKFGVFLHASPEPMDPAKAAAVVSGELKAWK